MSLFGPTIGQPTRSRAHRAARQFFAVADSFAMAHSAAREAERLMMLSDEALARRGLRREHITRHTFRSYFDG